MTAQLKRRLLRSDEPSPGSADKPAVSPAAVAPIVANRTSCAELDQWKRVGRGQASVFAGGDAIGG